MISPLLSRGGHISLARLVVKQAEDEIPHDQTSLSDQDYLSLIADVGFRLSSRQNKMASLSQRNCFASASRVKQLHGFVTTDGVSAILLRTSAFSLIQFSSSQRAIPLRYRQAVTVCGLALGRG
jgi:hypothetical protein